MTPQTTSDALVGSTIDERAKIYGRAFESHQNIGLAWSGILQQHYGITFDHPIPASVVALMMCDFKASRSCRVFHGDNFVDLHAYARFAEEFQQREQSDPKI